MAAAGMSWFHLACGVALAISGVIWLIRRILTPVPISTIPHNFQGKRVPLFGDGEEMDKYVKRTGSAHAWFAEQYRRHGPICQNLLPFGLHMVLLHDPEAIYDLANHRTPKDFDRDQGLAKGTFGPFMKTGQVSILTNDVLRAHRKALGPVLSKGYFVRMVPRMTDVLIDLMELWRIKVKLAAGRPFDAAKDIVFATADISGTILFSHTYGETKSAIDYARRLPAQEAPFNALGALAELPSVPSELFEATNEVNQIMGRAIASGFPRIFHFFDSWRPGRRRVLRKLRGYLARQMERARLNVQETGSAEGEKGDSVVMMLAEKEDSPQGLRLETDEIVDELLTLNAAGSETTAYALQWALKLMSRHPDEQRKLHDVRLDLHCSIRYSRYYDVQYLITKLPRLDERLPTYDDLATSRVPYLDAFVYELTRLSSAVGAFSRVATRDTQLLGHFIPKGTWIMSCQTSSWDESAPNTPYDEAEARKRRGCGYWRDPHLFNPSRWLDTEGQFDLHAGPNFEFSSGPRGCWGKTLALLELKVFIAILSLSFFFDTVPDDLNTDVGVQVIAVHPKECYCRPTAWNVAAQG